MKRLKNKIIVFKDYPDFRPNLSPKEVFQLGSFGGTYYRPIKSNITNKKYKDQHLEYPKNWFNKLDIETQVCSSVCNSKLNFYKVKSGQSLRAWEEAGWIEPQDPYGWFQWYCRFYNGRRDKDDERQIKRWMGVCGPKGRWKNRLINMINDKKTHVNDFTVSPVIRQLLQHWGYRITSKDLK
tara:strand:+ start:38 stop:583 length:546 start_codon:yes stop_codon:yes gene_type:complete